MTSTDAPRAGTRQTWQRAAVRDLMERVEEFRTAQQVHDLLRDDGAKVGLATVYRALQSMADADEVDVLRTPEGELAYRACSSGHHHHLVCRSCGHSVEIQADEVEEWAALMARKHGFTDAGHELEIFGLCRDCS
ncbi:Fur family transcriptional regulator [Tessaracoccus sp. Y36]|uniref:Fur family transcriptional regulator n=1 Tax=Tessaracoccus sp. ZS01 TaxID=1906324 RepID=UPI00096E5E50|nr:transcriptional repressor [Tessaracoccus sp. ZS01]MCG6566598.1 transcriptional repressor [Tessaracoccus sp. ZS01]OMG59023.1 transcriptional repressor [Tessaracoccus sp. ZS01]